MRGTESAYGLKGARGRRGGTCLTSRNASVLLYHSDCKSYEGGGLGWRYFTQLCLDLVD
jgi:hypothetical protein